jgi:ADP-heptose:LPS heptosyltransferase
MLFVGIVCLFRPIYAVLFEREFKREEIEKILVFQLGGIGDVVQIFPTIKVLRDEFPSATISTLTRFNEDLFKLFPYPEIISRMYRYERSGSILRKVAFFISLRKANFDLIFNPNRGNAMFEASVMALIIGAPHRLGFEKEGAGFFNTIRSEFRYDRAIFEQNLGLLRKIGIEIDVKDVAVRIPEADKTFGDDFVRRHAIKKDDLLITIHTEARYDKNYKIWPTHKYAELIRKMIVCYKAVVILIGNEVELPRVSRIMSRLQHPHLISTVGKTSISQMAALISKSKLFIGNDSGPLHLAIALDIPSIGIFMVTSPDQLIPLHKKNVVAIRTTDSPPYLHQPFFKFHSIDAKIPDSIPVSRVTEAAEKISVLRNYDELC